MYILDLFRIFNDEIKENPLAKEIRESKAPPKLTKQPTSSPPDFKSDIEALALKFGELKSGMTIEIELKTALEIMPRKRKRSDAYKMLQKWLYENMNIKLVVTSKKSKYEISVNVCEY